MHAGNPSRILLSAEQIEARVAEMAREIRRDYPALVRAHAHRADRIIVISRFTAAEVERPHVHGHEGDRRDTRGVAPPHAPPASEHDLVAAAQPDAERPGERPLAAARVRAGMP